MSQKVFRCENCQSRARYRDDVLCRRCHDSRRRGSPGAGSRPLAVKPTRALPGSSAKIRVMRDRYGRGEELFHPGDACGDGPDGEPAAFREERRCA